ncbi:MAG: biotin synthase BioB [Verrucomicrobiota bacterium]
MTKEITLEKIQAVYALPFFELIQRGRNTYLEHWTENEVQLCKLLSIKTGGCSEDCSYCAQSARYKSQVVKEKLMRADEVLPIALEAKENGATRFCMGAAWKGVKEGEQKFETVLETIEEVSKLGLEVCVTLGSLTEKAAQRLKEAGLTAYNHNIDTSPEHYPNIVSTHTFEDRLNTIKHVQKAGISVCSGGILGLGEGEDDRLKMLQILANMDPQPESVPINCLMAMPGTPLEDEKQVDIFEVIRMIATTRIFIPAAKVRLSAGRSRMSREAQALAFFAGANAIFYGDKLLTAGNPAEHEDMELLRSLGLKAQPPRPAHSSKTTLEQEPALQP